MFEQAAICILGEDDVYRITEVSLIGRPLCVLTLAAIFASISAHATATAAWTFRWS